MYVFAVTPLLQCLTSTLALSKQLHEASGKQKGAAKAADTNKVRVYVIQITETL